MWLLVVSGAVGAAVVAAVAWSSMRVHRPSADALPPPGPHRTTLRERRRRAPDPLVALAVQVRLGRLADELRAVEADPDVYARAHHYLAAQGAYDALLREACRLSGLDVEADPLRAGLRSDEDERLREELELSARGWTW
ncbi:hypothetical protein [Oerskovia turbata]|uniref:hypothetical protein n=1 Tax=Oerskovia turbata TaxID=1713 RepID=UPI000A869675|nr:hypothetical protein [Oerskovia turbata]